MDDAGGAFCMGLVGGSIWHMGKGAHNSPKGWGSRFSGGISAVKARAPNLGGQFAIWGLVFSSFDCTLTHFRRKEDPWNAILSGAATGGLLAARAGPKAAGRNALIGGVLLALIEGLGIMINKALSPTMDPNAVGADGQPADPLAPPDDPKRLKMPSHRSLASVRPNMQMADMREEMAADGEMGGFDLGDVSTDHLGAEADPFASGDSFASAGGGGGFGGDSFSSGFQDSYAGGGFGQSAAEPPKKERTWAGFLSGESK